MNIYIGNLDYKMSNEDLKAVFEAHGEVEDARIIMDRNSGRSKGFGFVDMPNDDEGNAAIEALNGQEVSGRTVTVNEARPRQDRN
ncbi:MAG: RNA recognition motif domain-containing protein [Planctomycetota bacterium]|jgi:RNA recognition motif-containing protein